MTVQSRAARRARHAASAKRAAVILSDSISASVVAATCADAMAFKHMLVSVGVGELSVDIPSGAVGHVVGGEHTSDSPTFVCFCLVRFC
jgi:hypothetical protein